MAEVRKLEINNDLVGNRSLETPSSFTFIFI